jgi:hypothetical protein
MSDEFDDALDHRGPRSRLIPLSAVDDVRRPKVPRLMSRLYRTAAEPLRARMLRCLIRPLGPLGLAAIASGAFADVLRRGGERSLDIPLDSLGRYSNDQVVELVQFVQQVSPEAIQQVTSLLSDTPMGSVAFTAAAAMLLARLVMGSEPMKATSSSTTPIAAPPERGPDCAARGKGPGR